MGLTVKGGVTGALQEVEANTLAARGSIRPLDIGALGSYRASVASGTIAAGTFAAGNAGLPLAAFRYTGASICVVKRIAFSAVVLGTAFTAGFVQFQAFAARAFSASDSGGNAATMTGNNGKMKTVHATTGGVDFRIGSTTNLTAGTRTLDAQPFAQFFNGLANTAWLPITVPATMELFRANPGDWPLVLAPNEGFVIEATTPATGTFSAAAEVSWDEVASFLP